MTNYSINTESGHCLARDRYNEMKEITILILNFLKLVGYCQFKIRKFEISNFVKMTYFKGGGTFTKLMLGNTISFCFT